MAHRLEVWVQYIADNSTNSNETFSHQQPQPTQEESNSNFGKTTQTPFMDDETHEIKSETRNYPTIEAINAVVLAWIQTGTKEGFLRAESWALKALDFPHLKKEGVHVNTFLPIIMAWTSCGEQYGVERIKEWVEKLNELSILFEKENQSQGETATNNHDLRVNAHILHALISAWFRHQQVLYDTNGAENTAEIIHAAHQSTYWLEKLCELEKHPNMFVEPLNGWVFVHVIETWAKAYKIQHFNAKADAERSGNEWDSSTFFPAKEICSAKIFHVVKLMNSKITLKDDNQPQMFDLLHTFHLVYIHALQSLPRTKKAGQSLQINSQFIDIQQMLYISDILYPHLMETFNDGLSHDVTFSDMDTISFLVIPHMYLRLLKVANNNKDHPYTLFYMKILQLSKSFQTVSQGLRLKTVHGIIDRLSLSNTSIINSRSDKSEIWKWMINSLDTIPTFKDRKEIMEIVVENGIVTAENPDMLLELVGKVMRNPSYARANRRPSKDVLDNWLNQLKKHAKKSV